MQSVQIFLSLSLLISWTVRCTNFHQETKQKDFNYSVVRKCFFKKLNNKEEKKSEFFSTLLICVEYYFLDKKEIGDSESTQERISYKTYMAEFSIKNENNVKSFDETGYFENLIEFYNSGKKELYVDKLKLKILDHPSMIEIRKGNYKETTIDQRNCTFKKLELQLIKGLDSLKLIKLKNIEFKNDDPFEESYISRLPRMVWGKEKLKRIDEITEFDSFLFRIFWYKENIGKEDSRFYEHLTENIGKSELRNFGFLVENIENVNEESSVINILSKYFGEEAKGINKVEKKDLKGNEDDVKEEEEKIKKKEKKKEILRIKKSQRIKRKDGE